MTPAAEPWREFARAPLVPVALAVTLGLVADRHASLPAEAGLVVAALGLVGWFAARNRSPWAVALLWAAFAGLAAAYHHAHRHSFAADDIGEFVAPEPRLVRLRATLTEDPATRFAPAYDPLEPPNRSDHDAVVVRVSAIAGPGGVWQPASGLARLTVERDSDAPGQPPLAGVRAGDSVELVGVMARPRPPGNPGERDHADALLDKRVRAEVWVSDSAAVVTRLDRGTDPVAAVRRAATAALTDNLPKREAATAVALLLGDGSAMDRREWDAYIRTGVVHALAISGQHLAVLAGFLWLALRAVGVRRSRGAWVVVAVVVGYTVLTGLRPSSVRAAAMVAAACGSLILRRPTFGANAFALGWLAVVALDPTDPFSLGCRLSFLAVFVLVWAGRWLYPEPPTALDRLIDESRPAWVRAARALVRWVLVGYGITVMIWAATLPMFVAEANLATPVGVLIGPVVVVLTSVALVAGFLLMLAAPLGPVAWPFAVVVRWSLVGCEAVVRWADGLPGASVHVAGPPAWWVVGFYAVLVAVVLVNRAWRLRLGLALGVWVIVGQLLPAGGGPADELRVTFLAVGKGGCTVVETPDGRCLVYDAGATAGPAAVRRVVAPYLWHRGVRRIDELFLSHADADHFNGVAELLRRFPVGQVTLTPSFAEKPAADVAAALLALEQHGVPRRVAVAGDRFAAGDVEVEVLHPPPNGPPGIENVRSLVLHVRHAGHAILLTGDVERTGTAFVVNNARPADVLMAPHHGSRAALPRDLVERVGPRLVVVSRGPAVGNTVADRDAGVPVWDTFAAGAITLRSHRTGLVAEAYRTGERVVVTRGR